MISDELNDIISQRSPASALPLKTTRLRGFVIYFQSTKAKSIAKACIAITTREPFNVHTQNVYVVYEIWHLSMTLH